MTLLLLRSFVEVHRCLSITEAARRLNMTQPAVSQHISALETQLDRQLFLRRSRGVTPTGFADELAAEIGDGLDKAEAALSSMKARSTSLSGTVHMAGPAELMAEKIAPHIKTLQDEGLQVRLQLGGKVSLYEMLLKGQVDLAFTASKPMDDRLGFKMVGSETLLLVASAAVASTIGRAKSPAGMMHATPYVAYDSDRPLIREWCDANNINLAGRRPAVTAPDIRLLRSLVEADVGWSVVPDYLCEMAFNSGTLRALNAPIANPKNDFFLVWTKASLRHTRVAFTRNTLLNALRQPNEPAT